MRQITAARALAVLGALAATAGAQAQVSLETAVSKVETTLEQTGRVKRELIPTDTVVPGDELRYTITFENDSDMPVDAGRIIITNPIPDGTVYVSGSAGGDDTLLEYSTDGETFSAGEPPSSEPGVTAGEGDAAAATVAAAGTAVGGGPAADDSGADAGSGVRSLRWTYQHVLAPGQSSQVYFHVRMR